MKKTLSHFKTAALVLALLVVGCFSANAGSTLGFNYWPNWTAQKDSRVLDTTAINNWTPANKAHVERELDQMASLGCGMIRLMLWPQSTGWWLQNSFQVCSPGTGTYGPGGSVFCSDFTDQTAHIVDLIRMCKARNMHVIICFANTFLNVDPNPNNTNHLTYWQEFSPYNSNFAPFLWDTIHWVNGFADSIRTSDCASSVYFYDIENEYARNLVNAASYSTYVFDASSIPPLKKGHSVLSVADAQNLQSAMGPNRTLYFTDIHCYPRVCPTPPEANLEWAYDQMQAIFPSSTTIMGEFGAPSPHLCPTPTPPPPCGCPNFTEGQQEDTVVNVATRAKAKNIPYHVHWTFLDSSVTTNNYALGYQAHQMKDAMGGLITVENLIPNADLESITGVPAVPTGWGFGSSTGTFTTFAALAGAAQTNTYCGRITRTTNSGSVWMNVPLFNVTGASGKKLYIDFFLRSSMTGVYPAINEYNAAGGFIRTQTGTSYTPGTWTWYNYREMVGSQSFTLDVNTRSIRMSIVGTSVSNPAYLDVDTISAFEQ
jgi:hypothetical protein